MNKFLAILSSIITAGAIYISVILHREVKEYIAYSFESMKGFGMLALIIFVLGIILAWNLWMLQKSNVLSVIVSLLIVIVLIYIMFNYLKDGFLYPFILIGAYGYMLAGKLWRNYRSCKKVSD